MAEAALVEGWNGDDWVVALYASVVVAVGDDGVDWLLCWKIGDV